MKKKRKIWGTLTALFIVVSIVMVSLPAEKNDKNINKNDCGCSCNEAPTQGRPLNYYDILEKTKGWEQDVALLEKEIQEKREELYNLYEKGKNGEGTIDKIQKLRSEIEKLENEYWYKKEVLFEIEVIKKYTELQSDGTLKIVRESLPEIDNLDFEIAFNRNGSQFMGEKRIQKEAEIYDLLERAKKGEDVWNEIQRLESEISSIEEKEWKYRREYLRRRMLKAALETPTPTWTWYCFDFQCDDKTTPLQRGSHYLSYWRPIKVWIGMYDGPNPNTSNFLGETCSTYFTTDMDYYWELAKEKKPNLVSIQVKWFYLARAPYDDGKDHDIIWEKNKNAQREWSYAGYADYTTTHKSNGYYGIGTPCANKMVCCYNGGCHWCNDHCNGCFACDPSAHQHFVAQNP